MLADVLRGGARDLARAPLRQQNLSMLRSIKRSPHSECRVSHVAWERVNGPDGQSFGRGGKGGVCACVCVCKIKSSGSCTAPFVDSFLL